jgi:acetamidase/formamidase
VTEYKIGRDTFHYKWSKSHKPVLSVRSGDTVEFEINDVGSWQITKDWKSEDMGRFDNSKLYPLSGPVHVEGAEPGDSLVVDVLEVRNGSFGWTSISPGYGLLEEFNEHYLYIWQLGNSKFAHFEKGIRIPIRPFCGVMGVAPAEEGFFDVTPPGKNGGNLDVRHLTSGSSLELPVWVGGALFSAGDVHAAMGDGEVCVSAIECAGTARLRFSLKKGANLKWPRFYTKGDERSTKGYYVATGIADELMEATKESVRNMIGYLTKEYGLSKEEAYVLCSVAADVRIHEVVDAPNWVVGTMIPLDCFP